MSAATITTVSRMLESLPDAAQERVAEHVREYIEELQDELRWDAQFAATQPQLAAATRRAREQIATGQSKPMDLSAL